MIGHPFDQYVRGLSLIPERVGDPEAYPFSLAAVKGLGELTLHPNVTFIVGENGSGKSTLLEAIAAAYGFNAEGGTRHLSFATEETHSELHRCLRLTKGMRAPRDGFFLRAESFYNVATEIDRRDRDPEGGGPPLILSYGGVSLHAMSHGESFLALFLNRFRGKGFYILDEPEAALSPTRQMAFTSWCRMIPSLSSPPIPPFSWPIPMR